MDEKTLAKALSDHQKELRQLIDRRLPMWTSSPSMADAI